MHPDILPLHAAIETRHWWFVARRRILHEILRTVASSGSEAHLLDLGCGTGGNIGDLCDSYRCIGVELDAAAVSFASERYPGCTFRRGSIYDPSSWGLADRVDVCFLTDVLEHLDDDRSAVENATQSLRTGGHLLITVPADPRLWSRHDRHHDHCRRYTHESLATLVSDLPVEVRLLSYFNSRLYRPIRAWRWLQNRSRWLAERGTTGDLSMPPAAVNRALTRMFLSEAEGLVAAIDQPELKYRRGVSLIAVCRRSKELA